MPSKIQRDRFWESFKKRESPTRLAFLAQRQKQRRASMQENHFRNQGALALATGGKWSTGS